MEEMTFYEAEKLLERLEKELETESHMPVIAIKRHNEKLAGYDSDEEFTLMASNRLNRCKELIGRIEHISFAMDRFGAECIELMRRIELLEVRRDALANFVRQWEQNHNEVISRNIDDTNKIIIGIASKKKIDREAVEKAIEGVQWETVHPVKLKQTILTMGEELKSMQDDLSRRLSELSVRTLIYI